MRKAKISLGVASLVASVLCVCLALRNRAEVGLLPTADVINLGKVQRGEVVPVTFELKNYFPYQVGLLKLRATCSCAIAKPSKWILMPGETVKISVKYEAGVKLGPTKAFVVVGYAANRNKYQAVLRLQADVTAASRDG